MQLSPAKWEHFMSSYIRCMDQFLQSLAKDNTGIYCVLVAGCGANILQPMLQKYFHNAMERGNLQQLLLRFPPKQAVSMGCAIQAYWQCQLATQQQHHHKVIPTTQMPM